ncbi:unnamed protein product [Bursaphelenchus xylophilus]|uniref:(pine wood nematode) hypothetical protein n=1 Tax=Bursaphelenchus xylophilus TaxID=6326 RepID=A0A1I7RQ29_BURXY|nr:unnamed protein product [Bursaphelenchus xylophilus]CAG9097054.1 unnamed protein product [Bursaphelenchus xylophilus]
MHSLAPSDPELNPIRPDFSDVNDSILGRMLTYKQHHRTDQLFAVSDYDIITELHPALSKIKQIVSQDEYSQSLQDQSVVELVLSRITAAIRETNCIETYAPALIDLFETCLAKAKGQKRNQNAHEKLAGELMSTLFLYHSKQSVMTVTIPSTIEALDSKNVELVRNATSYLSLGAVHNGRILAQYAVQLITKVLKGNLPLVRVLPQIYPENKEPFHAHLSQLLALLYDPRTDQSEKLSILQLISMIAGFKPDLIVPHLSEFDDFLLNPHTCSSTLVIFASLISCGRVGCLTGQLVPLRRAVQQQGVSQHNLLTIVKILSVIARSNQQMATVATQDILAVMPKLTANNLPAVFKELEEISNVYPSAVFSSTHQMRDFVNSNPSLLSVYSRIQTSTANCLKDDDSRSMSSSHRHLTPPSLILPNDPAPLNDRLSLVTLRDENVQNLDRNTQNLAEIYRQRSSGTSLRKSQNSMTGSHYPEDGLKDYDVMSKSATLPPSLLPRIPSHIYDGIRIREDGRVRPISYYFKPRGQITDPKSTTTFPVLDKNRGHLSGSSIRMIDEHQRGHRAQSNEGKRQENSNTLSREERGDVVKKFVEHRRSKIKRYVNELTCQYPIPVKCTVEGVKGSKTRMKVHFSCQLMGPHCLFDNFDHLFVFKTKFPEIWLHLMFLQVQVSHIFHTNQVLDQDSPEFKTLQNCWDCLSKNVTNSRAFVTLVTSAFPGVKEQSQMLKELQDSHFFDSFVYIAGENKWACFSCAHPDRTKSLLKTRDPRIPILEGQLKEKKGKWRLFHRWHTKYFTLSSAALIISTENQNRLPYASPSIDLCKIKSVRSLNRGKKTRKSLPRAFEVRTQDDHSFVLKANNQNNAEEWFHSIQIAVAQAQKTSR